jgi:hypothetical protein
LSGAIKDAEKLASEISGEASEDAEKHVSEIGRHFIPGVTDPE